MLDETKKQFTPNSESAGDVTATRSSAHILAFSTSNFDAMKKFLADFGFIVVEGHDQLLPLFTDKRGAMVSRGSFQFQLEESDDPKHRACFNLFLTDFSGEELERVQALGYTLKHEISIYGESHSIETPDGGTFEL
jgi:hypothetical protein